MLSRNSFREAAGSRDGALIPSGMRADVLEHAERMGGAESLRQRCGIVDRVGYAFFDARDTQASEELEVAREHEDGACAVRKAEDEHGARSRPVRALGRLG